MLRRRGSSIVIACLFATGCFSSIPVDVTTVPRGEEVVVHVDQAASQRLSLEAGYTVRSLRGLVESVDTDSLYLSVWAGRRYHGVTVDNTRRIHTIALPEVVAIERRELNRTRTALVGLGVVAGVVLLIDQARGGGGDSQPLPPDPGPTPAGIRW